MIAILATLKVKLAERARFLKYLEADGVGSLEEPGCLRFDILEDASDPSCFCIYEVYRDEAAYATHQEAPYFKEFFSAAGDTLDGAPEIRTTKVLFPRSAPAA